MVAKLSWFTNDSIDSIKQTAKSIHLHLTSKQVISAKLLIVAEGAQSPTRDKLGINASVDDYQQSAVIANVHTLGARGKLARQFSVINEEGEAISTQDHVAFERFTTNGPIAFLPIGTSTEEPKESNNGLDQEQQSYSVVWTQTPERAQYLSSLDDESFCQQLQQAFGYGAGKIITCSNRAHYPLKLVQSDSMISNRVAFVGNSVHTLHPIGGQGFNLGVRDVGALVEFIQQAHNQQQDIGDINVLAEYQRARKADIKRLVGFTDGLVRLFGLQGRLPAFARTLGLMTLQKVDFLQHWVASNFMSNNTHSAKRNI